MSDVPSLIDTHGRAVRDLRISVTDRRNLRCVYCMPAEGMPWLPEGDLLTYEEIARFAGVCLTLAARHAIATIAFPAISTGAYGFPIEDACRIALGEVERSLAALPAIRDVSFVCFDASTLDCYAMAWARGGDG